MLLVESIWIWFWVKAFAVWMGMLFFKFKWVHFSLRACLDCRTRTVIQNYTPNSISIRLGIDQTLKLEFRRNREFKLEL